MRLRVRPGGRWAAFGRVGATVTAAVVVVALGMLAAARRGGRRR
jgi:hypothetical protein